MRPLKVADYATSWEYQQARKAANKAKSIARNMRGNTPKSRKLREVK